MRFMIRPGADPAGAADATLLSAMGLPGGGVIAVGDTHVLVRAGDVPTTNALLLGPRTMGNSGLAAGDTVKAERVQLPVARRVIVSPTSAPLDARHLARALQGIPVTNGDTVGVNIAYGDGAERQHVELQVVDVEPGGAGLVGSATVVGEAGEAKQDIVVHPEGHPSGEAPTTAEALLAGLDTELEVLTGWLSLLSSTSDLPDAWGLPRVAGVLLEGPSGCGKSELVAAAAAESGSVVHEVSLDLVFKPEKLLDLLEKAVKQTTGPAVVFVDRLDAVAGDEGMFRNQVAAIMRWFLDAVAERPRIATVLGVTSAPRLVPGLVGSPLLPRTLSIPPPDHERRALLFEAGLSRVPHGEMDYESHAARSAGFSGADILAAVVHASALIAPTGEGVTDEILARAVSDTTPSLGTASLGEIPSYGFERVANLDEVKQRLTESVIWQMTEPGRFERLGIEPPRGLLLHGPPGTGKTFVIRALANESGAAFFTIKGAELLDKFVGESERGVREIFARARAVAPAILFFDEIDALAPVRGSSTNSVTDSVVAALLTEMDGVSDRGDVFVIGATNRKDLVDPALLRPGRLEVHLHLGLPAPESCRAYFGISDVPLADDIDVDEVIEKTDGLSFADLSGLLREAALNALRRDASALEVSSADLEAAILRRTQPTMG
ncbi:MAG: AAA family ATPase [Acidimicrobiia bacterium]|nr:AAA family ATPase [Acidimicrobiia bacterium]